MDETDADIAAEKTQLRARLRFRRDHYAAALSEFVQAIAFRAAPAPLRALLGSTDIVGGYIAHRNEAPVDGLLIIASEAGGRTALPWFELRNADMRFAAWQAGEALATGPWHVPQPAASSDEVIPKLLLCPLLGFDRRGGRLGLGGGHYDRWMEAHPDSLRIGIAWSVQEVDAVPCEPHDLPLDAILTEQEWIVTGERL